MNCLHKIMKYDCIIKNLCILIVLNFQEKDLLIKIIAIMEIGDNMDINVCSLLIMFQIKLIIIIVMMLPFYKNSESKHKNTDVIYCTKSINCISDIKMQAIKICKLHKTKIACLPTINNSTNYHTSLTVINPTLILIIYLMHSYHPNKTKPTILSVYLT